MFSRGTMPAGWKPPKMQKQNPPQNTYTTNQPYYSQQETRYSPPEKRYISYSRQVSGIADVIALLEALRLKHKKRALTTSLSNQLKHWQAQADDDLNIVDAYISMCKGVFENSKVHFEDALHFLERGRAAIPTSHYALTLLCQAYLASDEQEQSRKIQAARNAAQATQEKLPNAIFYLIIAERQSDPAVSSIANRIRDLIEEEMESSEMRYNPVFDQAEIERRRAEYNHMLERAMDRWETRKRDIMSYFEKHYG